MKAYLDILKDVREHGVRKPNRTGVDTFSITGAMFKHDMREGFPLLTTKKMPPKCIFAELEGFIKGITDKRWYESRKCSIWSEWSNPKKIPYGNDETTKKKMKAEPDLGKIYGYMWSNFGDTNPFNLVEVSPRTKPENRNAAVTYPLWKIIDVDVQKICCSKQTGMKYNVFNVRTEKDEKNKSHLMCDVQFLHTGYVKPQCRYDHAINGKIKDPYEPRVHNVGFRGDENAINDFIECYGNKIYTKMQKCWIEMLSRCYNTQCKTYHLYGEKGIFVDSAWHDFSNFLRDCKKIDGWVDVLRCDDTYDLDKDYYASNCYSVDTCKWLTHSENVVYAAHKGTIKAISPDGTSILCLTSSDASKISEIHHNTIQLCLSGKRNNVVKGWKFEYIDDNKIYRYSKPVNQLKNAIETLKRNPTDRRMIVMAWNPAYLDEMALPPCHFGFHLISDGQFLDLCWFQRSVDTFLGLPFNIASYGMLLTLIAKQVGMTPRYLVGHLDDVHIYENHLSVVDEQLSRVPDQLPGINILNADKEGWTIWDWEYTDFELVGYNPQGKLSAPVAV